MFFLLSLLVFVWLCFWLLGGGRGGRHSCAYKTVSSLLTEFEHLHSYTLVSVRLKAFFFSLRFAQTVIKTQKLCNHKESRCCVTMRKQLSAWFICLFINMPLLAYRNLMFCHRSVCCRLPVPNTVSDTSPALLPGCRDTSCSLIRRGELKHPGFNMDMKGRPSEKT